MPVLKRAFYPGRAGYAWETLSVYTLEARELNRQFL